mgnify:FL=1
MRIAWPAVALLLTCAGSALADGGTSSHAAQRDNYSSHSAAWQYHDRMSHSLVDSGFYNAGPIDVTGEWQIEKLAKSIGGAYRSFKASREAKRDAALTAQIGDMLVADDVTWQKYKARADKQFVWLGQAIVDAGGALVIAHKAAARMGDEAYDRAFNRAIAEGLDLAALEYALWLQGKGPEGATRAIEVLSPWCSSGAGDHPNLCTELGLAYFGGVGTRVDLAAARQAAQRAWDSPPTSFYRTDEWMSRYHMLQGIRNAMAGKDIESVRESVAHFRTCYETYHNPQCVVPMIRMLDRAGMVISNFDFVAAERVFSGDFERLTYAQALVDHGGEPFYSRGKQVIDQLAAKGDLAALTLQNNVAWRELPKEQRCQRLPKFQALAKQGSPPATRDLALMKDDGECMPKDQAAATKLLEEAAPLDVTAKRILALRYWDAKGVERDRDRTVELLGEAAEAGEPESLYLLGYMYWTGNYVGKDKEEGRYYLERAAAQGQEQAIEVLATAP